MKACPECGHAAHDGPCVAMVDKDRQGVAGEAACGCEDGGPIQTPEEFARQFMFSRWAGRDRSAASVAALIRARDAQVRAAEREACAKQLHAVADGLPSPKRANEWRNAAETIRARAEGK